MNISTVLSRAVSAIGKETVYKSPGKMPPFDASSWPLAAQNDCSGFVDWCLRFSPNRKVDHPLYKKVNGGWFETTGIHADGNSSTGFFTRLADPGAGALLVYPDHVGADGKSLDWPHRYRAGGSGKGIKGVQRVIHCSLGSFKKLGDAVQVTGPQPWVARPDSIIVWLDGLSA